MAAWLIGAEIGRQTGKQMGSLRHSRQMLLAARHSPAFPSFKSLLTVLTKSRQILCMATACMLVRP